MVSLFLPEVLLEASEKHWERLLDLFDRNLKITD